MFNNYHKLSQYLWTVIIIIFTKPKHFKYCGKLKSNTLILRKTAPSYILVKQCQFTQTFSDATFPYNPKHSRLLNTHSKYSPTLIKSQLWSRRQLRSASSMLPPTGFHIQLTPYAGDVSAPSDRTCLSSFCWLQSVNSVSGPGEGWQWGWGLATNR